MRHILFAISVLAGFLAVSPRKADATEVTIELRHTPFLVRPNDTPSLCAMVALSLTDRLWLGGGYELVQDYDAIVWTSEYEGHKPIVMSGIRAGGWYRGGPAHHGMTWAAGPLFTFANSAISYGHSPQTLDRGTYVFDLGADVSIGHVWQGFRLEAFATPAWSLGRVSSPALGTHENYSAFTYRFGMALAILVGS